MTPRRLLELAQEADRLAAGTPPREQSLTKAGQAWKDGVRALWMACYDREQSAGATMDPSLRDLIPPTDLLALHEGLFQTRWNAVQHANQEWDSAPERLRTCARIFRTAANSHGSPEPAAAPSGGDNIAEGWHGIRSLKPGGQGSVTLVERQAPGVASGVLKRLSKERVADDKAARRLLREIAVLKRLRHPCIVRVLQASLRIEDPWIITEYAQLGSLADHSSVFKGDLWRVVRLVRDVASALSAAHEKGIIHRDVKPANILMLGLDHVALADFGIAFDSDNTDMTSANEHPGSRWFSPPERWSKARPTPSWDVYSVGRVMFVLLSGGERFQGDDYGDEDRLAKLLARPALAEVDALLRRIIASDPAHRLQTMSEVIDALDSLWVGLSVRKIPVDGCVYCGAGKLHYIGTLSSVDVSNRNTRIITKLSADVERCSSCGAMKLGPRA